MSECQHGRQVTSGERCEECYAEQRIRLAPLLESLPRWRPQPVPVEKPGFRVDIPDHVERWVSWNWIRGGEYLVVGCSRCCVPAALSALGLRAQPSWLVETVKKHNSCVPRLGALDPWEPGTP
jgi:hypothetical protein